MARRKTLPQVSPKVANELKPLVTAIKEIIETGEGVRGDPLDRKITLRDLVDGGIVKIKGGISPNNPGSLEPSPPPPNLSVPPAPTGFNAIGGFDGRIDLTWNIPGSLYSNHAYTNIYRAEEDNFANAILVGREAGAFYTDVVRDDVVPTPYYYWISFTSTGNIEGPLNSPSGTMAQALDIDYIVDLLDGKISESELANELLTPIQSIPSIQATLNDHDIRIPTVEGIVAQHEIDIPDLQTRLGTAEGAIVTAETDITNLQASVGSAETDIIANADATSALDARVTTTENDISAQAGQITSLQTTLNDLTVTEFDPSFAYSIGDLMRYSNVVYEVIATQSQPNATPPNATYYDPRPDYESLADTVSANSAAVSSLDTRVTAAEGTITSHTTDITLLQSDVSTAQGDISGNATAINSLDTRVTSAEGTITAYGTDITTLESTVNDASTGVAANAAGVSALDTRVTSAEGTITSLSSDVTALENTVNDPTTGVAANAAAANSLDTRVTATEGDISSQSTQLTNLNNSLTTAEGDITANSQALTLLDSRVTTAEGTISTHTSQITQLQTDVSNLDVDGNAAALQALDVRVTANEQDITAVASDITNLEASVNGNTSALQTKAEVSAVQDLENDITVLSAQYTIKLDVKGRVAGIGLANVNGASEFIVASDAVYFIDPGQSIQPFNPGINYSSMAAVRDTQLVFGYAEVEGFKRFVINVPAYIPEGYIESGMVGAISFGKITTDTGVPVTTVSGKLKADYIDVDNLAVASAATFYGDAQSGNYSAGNSGWRIQQSGTVEFQDGTFRGRIEADTGYISQNLQIGGTSQDIGDVLQMAQDADAGLSIVDSWKKPGYTLIDGNKIFTGVAYVDTLQIKGEAISSLATASWPYNIDSNPRSWRTLADFYYQHSDPNQPVTCLLWLNFVVATSTIKNMAVRVLINGSSEVYESPSPSSSSLTVTKFFLPSLSPGLKRIQVQYFLDDSSAVRFAGKIWIQGSAR